ncbi:MAG: quinone-dependent dihydroorotate dehydrogenase [Bacteroidia bacterium]|nr:quinone-dependent dihydroorotate dehydrogenase [Bacteroidia bacterium]
MYNLIKYFLFKLTAEQAHYFTFSCLKWGFKIPGVYYLIKKLFASPAQPIQLMGLTFKNRIGLAAGFDKDAKCIKPLSAFGFGFIEIGTVTPLPQPGNEKPRLFRLPADHALINRMGFNNAGAAEAANRLRKYKGDVIIGGNIGKNKLTENADAAADYLKCFDTLFNVVDYFVVNVSSPNTPGLRALQDKEPLMQLLMQLQSCNRQKPNPKPILLKIAPDLTNEQLDEIVEIILQTKLTGVVATNTTINRDVEHTDNTTIQQIGAGGLSGKPLKKRATDVISYIAKKSNKAFVIIGVGGIETATDAQEKIDAGADLVQVYTGFIYQGPAMVKRILKNMNN